MSSVYTLIPRPIYEFKYLDMTARYAFGLIYDRLQLSAKNRDRFTDLKGLYCIYSREEMAKEMGISVPTLRTAIRQLLLYQLIEARIDHKGGPWKYYLRLKAKESLCMQDMPEWGFYEPTWTEENNPIVDP